MLQGNWITKTESDLSFFSSLYVNLKYSFCLRATFLMMKIQVPAFHYSLALLLDISDSDRLDTIVENL